MKKLILDICLCWIISVTTYASDFSNYPSEIKSTAPSEITCMPPVTINDLPVMARQMIIINFGLKDVVSCKLTHSGTRFLVRLTNKRSVFFNESGQWVFIDCGGCNVPDVLVPSKIRNLIAEKYGPYVHVIKISQKDKKTKVTLNNEVKMSFDM